MLKSSYIKTHIAEYFFTLMISFGLAINVASSFVINESVFSNYTLIVSIVSVVNLLMFASGVNKKTTIVGIVLYFLITVFAAVYIGSTGKVAYLEGEKSGNTLMIIILIVSTTIVYLATRNKKIFSIFVPTATIVCAAFRFLEYPVSALGFVMLVLGIVLEFLYKTYYDSLMEATIGDYNVRHFVFQSLVIALIVSCMSYSIYAVVIKPVNMPTRDIKLITKLLSWDVIDKVGISSKTEVLSDTVKSNKETDKELEKEEPSEKPNQKENEDIKQKKKSEIPAFAIKYDYKESNNMWMISFVAVIPILPFIIKYFFRRNQRKKIKTASPAEGCMYLYSYFIKKLKVAKITKSDNLTLNEYVSNNLGDLSAFNTNSGTTFVQLTDIYVREIYGGYVPNDDDYTKFKDFYEEFFINMKNYIGKRKYIFKFWML